ncbi:MAG: fused response regulator/phosphatase [Phycisphaerales bacterium]|nr:fused response regulator/phosphatase [Phycisphaerales bacterium]
MKLESAEAVRVLLVDDQAMIGEAVRRILSSETGIIYEYCQDPLKAIETAERFLPTVILQDLVMPEVDGLDLVTQYRENEQTSQVPIVVLSSREEGTTKAEAFKRGANDYIVKLPDALELVARIRYHSAGFIAAVQRNEAFRMLEASEGHLRQELQKAADYVESLLNEPIKGAIATRWSFIPSASLGGDSFGYHWIDEDRFAIYLLDVCGHGVGPALLSISVINLIRSGFRDPEVVADPASVTARLNDSFQMSDHGGMFFTLFYGVYDRRTSELTWCGGGHPPSLIVSQDGTHSWLDSQNMVIGAMPGMEPQVDSIKMKPGDRLLVFSDGVFELKMASGEMWDFDEFKEFISRPIGSEDDRIAELTAKGRLLMESDQFEDDVSILEVDFK